MDDKDQIIENLRRELTETRRLIGTRNTAEARRKTDEKSSCGFRGQIPTGSDVLAKSPVHIGCPRADGILQQSL